MIIKEKVVIQRPLSMVLKENADSKARHKDQQAESKSADTLIQGSIGVDEILKMSLKDLISRNGGEISKTLQELNELMTRLQGTDDDIERKAYFKAKKMYSGLVSRLNKSK